MKVLLVTSQQARDSVERHSKESNAETAVLALNVSVAAFLTPKAICQALEGRDLGSYDLILTPGLINGDTSAISKAVGMPAYKGPRYDADLPIVLDSIGQVELSTTVPADDLLRDKLRKKAEQEIKTIEQNRDQLLKKPGNMLIGSLAVGKEFPMRVLAELVDAPLMGDETLKRLAKNFVEAGADVVDLGMTAGESRPEDAKRLVTLVKKTVNVPVSIDSLDPREIGAGVSAGADLVLSADAGNIDEIAPFVSEVAVVIIPSNQKQGTFPKEPRNVWIFSKISLSTRRILVLLNALPM